MEMKPKWVWEQFAVVLDTFSHTSSSVFLKIPQMLLTRIKTIDTGILIYIGILLFIWLLTRGFKDFYTF